MATHDVRRQVILTAMFILGLFTLAEGAERQRDEYEVEYEYDDGRLEYEIEGDDGHEQETAYVPAWEVYDRTIYEPDFGEYYSTPGAYGDTYGYDYADPDEYGADDFGGVHEYRLYGFDDPRRLQPFWKEETSGRGCAPVRGHVGNGDYRSDLYGYAGQEPPDGYTGYRDFTYDWRDHRGPGRFTDREADGAARHVRRFRGVVQDYETVPAGPQRQRPSALMVLIRSPEGRLRRINLGPPNHEPRLDLRVGDGLMVEGRVGMYRGLPTVMATRVKSEEQQWMSVEGR